MNDSFSHMSFNVSFALFLSILSLSSIIISTPIILTTLNELDIILEEESLNYDRLSNEIWADLSDNGDIEKKRIIRESIEKRSARKCRDSSCGSKGTPIELNSDKEEKRDRRQYQIDHGRSFNAVGENYNNAPPPPKISSPKKEECPIGPPGLPGPDGIPGIDGIPGKNGKSASSSSSYLSSQSTSQSCDEPCPSGPPGLPGYKGKKGLRGPIGPSGDVGSPGGDGMMGDNGPDGEIGMPGPIGLPGQRGVPGEDGVGYGRGLPGPRGDTGMMGMIGEEGYPGDRGDDAPPGEPGPPGPIGPPGLMGREGRPGPPGHEGRNGKDAEYCECPEKNSSPTDKYRQPLKGNNYETKHLSSEETYPRKESSQIEDEIVAEKIVNKVAATPTTPPDINPSHDTIKVEPSTYPPQEQSSEDEVVTHKPLNVPERLPGYEKFAHIESSRYKSRSQRTSKQDFARSLRRRLDKVKGSISSSTSSPINVEGSGEDEVKVKPRSSSSLDNNYNKEIEKKEKEIEEDIIVPQYRLL